MTIIRIYERIDKKVCEKVMPILDKVAPESEVKFILNWTGGVHNYHKPILNKVKELRYQMNCHLIAEGARFYSAAFELFIMCNERIIVPEFTIMIHLPEYSNRDLIKDHEMAQKLYKMKEESAEFVTQFTAFTKDQVYLYNCSALTARQLFKFKVAEKIVSIFNY